MAANKQIYSCTNTAENRCGKAWTWELGLVPNNYYQLITDTTKFSLLKSVIADERTSFNQLFTDITAFFVQNFVMDKNYV